MQIICVSTGTYGGGRDLARRLAEKMGYQCLGREDLIEAATKEGIQVGKLEMALIKPGGFTQRLARERDHYLAFSRAYLCQKAMEQDTVYYGRTGHLLLPGVTHVMRVRAVLDMEHRIETIMTRMGVEREKAVRYIQEVDSDRARWVKSMYGISVEEPINYDITVNLQQISVENAASALVAMAQLPDFQMTPASQQAMQDLLLGANARLALARDNRTYGAGLKVRADAGVLTVSYLPQDAQVATSIPQVLRPLQGIRDLRITMATASLLWIQEEFKPHSDTYEKVVEIATKWNAAVELLRLAPEGAQPAVEPAGAPAWEGAGARRPQAGSGAPLAENGGIEDDEPEASGDDGGLASTLDDLAEAGRAGGGRSVFGGRRRLLETVDRSFPYTLVVLGDVFLSKGHAARTRETRDLRSFLSDRIRAPVVTSDELGKQYLFSRRDLVRATIALGITIVLYILMLQNQEAVLAFMANAGWYADAVEGTFLASSSWLPKVVISLFVFIFIPIVAFSYGRVTGAFLKLIKME